MPTREFPCDLCGETDAIEVPHAREYTDDQPIHICTGCGFVYVKRRRSPQEIADTWSEDLFGEGYTAAIPAVVARLTYVAEWLDQTLGLERKRVLELGAGEGYFLDMVQDDPYGADVLGVEPSKANCARMADLGIEVFHGTVEQFVDSGEADRTEADICCILWTLENCHSCTDMLDAARRSLKEGGHVVVATGSRILVPFKKPLHDYLSTNPADTHAFRFSANTLRGVLAESGFEVERVNRYHDSDYLCMIARKASGDADLPWEGDDPEAVADFFERWHRETQEHYAEPFSALGPGTDTEESP